MSDTLQNAVRTAYSASGRASDIRPRLHSYPKGLTQRPCMVRGGRFATVVHFQHRNNARDTQLHVQTPLE